MILPFPRSLRAAPQLPLLIRHGCDQKFTLVRPRSHRYLVPQRHSYLMSSSPNDTVS